MNNIRNIESITEQELNAGIYGGLTKGSWHEEYKDSAWVFFGGFPFELSEGDIICVMSQWGEVEDINLVRDKATNKSKGFAFVKYEDNRSTILAVDNFNGMKLLGRTLRCDHVQEYRLPKEVREKEMEALENNPSGKVDIGPGHAYKHIELADDHDVVKGVDLWRAPKPSSNAAEVQRQDRSDEDSGKHKKHKKEKKEKKDHKEKKAKHHKDKRQDREESEHRDSSRRRFDSRDRESAATRNSERMEGVSTAGRSTAAVAVAPAAASVNTTAPPQRASLSSTSSIPAPFMNGAVASWRGNRDPTASVAQVSGSKRPYESGSGGAGGKGPMPSSSSGGGGYGGGAGGVSRRDMAPSGIGGASRIR